MVANGSGERKCLKSGRKIRDEEKNCWAYDLYEYLHDQGIQFHIEPESASGRVDLISAQSGKDRLMADAKNFQS